MVSGVPGAGMGRDRSPALTHGSRVWSAGRGAGSLTSRAVTEAERTYLQENQPTGVPPLELTGERTLPDVPEENYWYRRHVAVYQWIAERCAGLRVVDLASGEGDGSDLLAQRAAEVVGVDANPEAFEHASARYRRPNLRFHRGLVEEFEESVDAV